MVDGGILKGLSPAIVVWNFAFLLQKVKYPALRPFPIVGCKLLVFALSIENRRRKKLEIVALLLSLTLLYIRSDDVGSFFGPLLDILEYLNALCMTGSVYQIEVKRIRIWLHHR